MKKRTSRLVIGIACLFLGLADVSYWLSRNLLDAERFGRRVATAVQTQRSAQALATTLVDASLSESPLVRELVRGPAEEVVIWLVQRDLLAGTISRLAEGSHRALIRGEEVELVVEAESVQRAARALIAVLEVILEDEEQLGRLDQLRASVGTMQGITLIDTSRLPNLAGQTRWIPWVWPMSLLFALGLGFWVFKKTPSFVDTLRDVGVGIGLLAISISLFVPAAKQATIAAIASPLSQVLASEAVGVIARGLLLQNLLLLLVGVASWFYGRQAERAQ